MVPPYGSNVQQEHINANKKLSNEAFTCLLGINIFSFHVLTKATLGDMNEFLRGSETAKFHCRLSTVSE